MKNTDKVMAKKEKKPTIDDMLNDMENMMDYIKEIGDTSINDLNLEEINKKTNNFKEKYKDILPEESEDNLDTKK
jgi:hypothetical protein